VWEELAQELKGKVVVAKVDADKNAGLRSRFEIRGFPTLKFFRQGVFYNYTGDRSLASLISFVEGAKPLLSLSFSYYIAYPLTLIVIGDYKSVKGTTVPKVPTAVEELGSIAAKFLESLEKDLMHIYDLRKAAASLLIVFGFILGLAIAFICCAIFPPPLPPPPPSSTRRVAADATTPQSLDKKSK